MYLFRFLEKYSKIICVIYLVGAILSYLYFANHQDGRVALLWVIFIILAVVHLFETFARKWLRWYKKPYVNVGLSVLIVLLFFFIFTIPFQLYVIKTSSMRPTIFPENIVLVNKMAYRRQKPQTDDIVLIDTDFAPVPLVHRIIACQNDVVNIRSGVVTVNGEKIGNTSVTFRTRTIVVPNEAYFQKGDNPNSHFGIIYPNQILGKIIYISGGVDLRNLRIGKRRRGFRN